MPINNTQSGRAAIFQTLRKEHGIDAQDPRNVAERLHHQYAGSSSAPVEDAANAYKTRVGADGDTRLTTTDFFERVDSKYGDGDGKATYQETYNHLLAVAGLPRSAVGDQPAIDMNKVDLNERTTNLGRVTLFADDKFE